MKNGDRIVRIVLSVRLDSQYKINEKAIEMVEELEKNLSEEQIDEIVGEIEKIPSKRDLPDSHPLEQYANKLKDESLLNLLNEQEKEEFLKGLDFVTKEVVVRDPNNEGAEQEYEYHNRGLHIDAKKHVEEFANNLGLNGKEFAEENVNKNSVTVSFEGSKYDAMKPLMGKKIDFNDDFKKKINGLIKVIDDEGILKSTQAGESGSKEYSFANYFKASNKVVTLMTKDISKLDDEAKKAHLLQIKEANKEFENISKKYDKVINYIKDNFNLSEMSLPSNVYSGREPNTVSDITKRRQSLPNRWDYENMAPGVILNGVGQLLTTCKMYNISVDDFLNDPSKFYLDEVNKLVEKANAGTILPKTEPLGKRIARASVISDDLYAEANTLPFVAGRAIELITQIYDGKNKLDNVIVSMANLYEGNTKETNHKDLFGRYEVQHYENDIKYAFAFGDKYDNIYECFPNYKYLDGSSTNNDYYKELRESKLTLEEVFQKVKDAVNEYGKEEFKMWEESGGDIQRFATSGTVLHAGHQYLLDYIKEKKIDLNVESILNNEIKEFLISPEKAMFEKYADPELLSDNMTTNLLCKTYRVVNNALGNEWKLNLASNKKFTDDAFSKINADEGPNQNKNLKDTLSSNKENFFEWAFRRTSRQYKAVEQAVADFYDTKSPKYGDLSKLKKACKDYLEYKGVKSKDDVPNVSGKGKKRADFCLKVIESIDETIKTHPNITNDPEFEVSQIREPIDNNGDFENAVNENELDKEMNLDKNVVEKTNNKSMNDSMVEDDSVIIELD